MSRLTRVLLGAALLSFLATTAPAETSDHHQHRFSDAEKWAKVFDDPARDEWQKPDEVIRALKLVPEARVADIGAGTGYFAVRLARAVPEGQVFGVDAEPDMVRYLRERARREGLANLTAVAAKPGDPSLPTAVDLVILVDTYHHVPDRERYFRELKKALRPGGRLASSCLTVAAGMRAPFGGPTGESSVKSMIASLPPGLRAFFSSLKYRSRSGTWW